MNAILGEMFLDGGEFYKPFVVRTEEQNRLLVAWYEGLMDPSTKQAHNVLRRGDGFCCLGVQCNVYNAAMWRAVAEHLYDWKFESSIQQPPLEVSASMAVSQNPCFVVARDWLEGNEGSILGSYGRYLFIRATALNDDYNFSLAQIGGLVKDQIIDRHGTGTVRSCEILAVIMESENDL